MISPALFDAALFDAALPDAALPDALAWVVLIASGACELIWAQALAPGAPTAPGAPPGTPRPASGRVLRALRFAAGLALSLGGLALALTAIEVATAYAVWVGVGALVTLGYSVARGRERMTWLRVLFVACLLGGAVGLRAVG